MSYLLRVLLPDTPGSLGRLADALGTVDCNIRSVDVVQTFPEGTAMDDLVVEIPASSLPDTLITAAQGLDGVEVDSIRPFSGAVDRRGQIALLADVASNRHNKERAAERFVSALPQTMTAGWAILLDVSGSSRRVAASAAAPEDDGNNPVMPEISGARILDPESEQWIPEPWALLDSALAATPVGDSLLLILGRPGGPDFLASEVEHLGNLGRIAGAIIG
ncbi:amino acid-binding ACT domain protein [Corynebacterium argentoratense]|uniref:amino acid-binding ACT domain protein n=1 Tax=Corynebacterium argentoratense TaxID=42817 RepID=UPI001F290C46|nr:amino acid-binding ACT domain protein [Corynebacterium argentoratense]MCF1694682.1 amino acid-binding ACT domain protein [Corynebacterium argentoratense]MCF1736255.1 amino acid-binding ACT domain protein [Corynebacterium argentoratense]